MIARALSIAVLTAAAMTPVRADVVSAADSHYVLRHEGTTPMSPEATWERLVAPASWWHPDHTYSGDAGNLDLDVRAGGLWREEWPGGSVAHGQVVSVIPGKSLRLEAPFGPLQGVGAYTIWTITLEAIDGGTRIVFDESSIGPPSADMAELAKAVDFVKAEAMRRLTGAAEN
jgi:uncharacterized protein YndB with AHSA1/START domain